MHETVVVAYFSVIHLFGTIETMVQSVKKIQSHSFIYAY